MPYLGVRPADITSAAEAEIAGDLTVNTNNLKVDATTGRVGVGTASPQNLAHFKGTSSGENILHLDNSAGSGHGDTNNNVRVVSGNNGYWANLVIAGQQLEFKVQGGTSMLRVDSDGVKFNGDTAAANALDDYEEGTFTPTYVGLTISSVSSNTGRYTKIGNIVYVGVDLQDATWSSGGGHLGISNLPFSGATQRAFTGTFAWYYLVSNLGTADALAGYVAGGASSMMMYASQNNHIWHTIATPSSGSNGYFNGTFMYRT